MTLDKAGLIKEIDEAIDSLIPLSNFSQDKSAVLSPVPQILVNNMVSLLTVPVNALDENRGRGIIFANETSWKELLASIHRYFFSNALIAVEVALMMICRQKGYTVRHTDRDREIAASILEKSGDILNSRERRFLNSFGRRPPAFIEWFDTAVNEETMPDPEERKAWRDYFEALSIARNKVSHADSQVTEEQKTKLLAANIPVNFQEDNQVRSNVYAYKPVLLEIERFLRSLQNIQ
jgi:hypothetical protein